MDIIRDMQFVMGGTFWDGFWLVISRLYGEDLLLPLTAGLFWVADRSFARFFATVGMLQLWGNAFLKGAFDVPRPAESSGVRKLAISGDEALAFPSGHAQGAAFVWTVLAGRVRRWWFTALAVMLIVLTGLSRIYLGVHWPEDVVAGWLLGLAIALGATRAWPSLARVAGRIPFEGRIALAVAGPAALLLAWELLPFMAREGSGYRYQLLGALAGIWIGSLLEERYLRFDPAGRLSWQVAKVVLGVVAVLALRALLKVVVPASSVTDVGRYLVIGVVVTLVMPWLFRWIAARQPAPAPPRRAATSS